MRFGGVSRVCNLSRIPVSMDNNPLYMTSVQLLESPSLPVEQTELYKFHRMNKVKSLGDLFGVSFLTDVPHQYVFLPWLHYRPVSKYRDIAFIDFDVSEKVEKIKDLIYSIQKHGYVPDKFPDRKGGIVGYMLSNQDAKHTYIVSGNHRVAVLSAMGIPFDVLPETGRSIKPRDVEGVGVDYKNFPEEFSSDTIARWPSVSSGVLTEDQALTILNRYLEA
jgi:hypothetical protein